MLKRVKRSLSLQISLFVLAMVVLCAVLVGVSGFVLYRNDTIDSAAQRALSIADAAAAMVDPEGYQEVMDSGEKNDAWYNIKRAMDDTKVRTGVQYLYVLDADYDDYMTYFVEGYDDANDLEDEYDFGDEEPVVINGEATYADEMYQTLATGQPTTTDVYTSGDFGSMVSGFAAIKDANGRVLGVVGTDISVNEVMAATNAFAFSIVIIILVFCVLAAIVSIQFIKRRIGRPVGQLTAASEKMAQGDMEVVVETRRSDEIGQLAAAFGRMVESTVHQAEVLTQMADGDLTMHVQARGDKDLMSGAMDKTLDNLNRMFEDVTQSSHQVSMAAEQIASGAQDLAGGSTQQAATLQEFSASISDVLRQSQENAQQASEASVETAKAGELMVQSMESMNSLSQSMQDLIASSENIARVIKVVDDIAFQTNILALNAAVEAARAGQHGKGFAVVADEVRNLAAKSAEAAKETAAMIEDNIQKVGQGAGITADTQQMLDSVNEIVASNAAAMQHINEASTVQNQAIEEINQGISQLSDVVQNNSATAEESAAAAEEMASQAQTLSAIVSRFRLRSELAAGQHGSTAALPSAGYDQQALIG